VARSLGAGQRQAGRLRFARRRILVILIGKNELFRLRVVSSTGIDILFPFHIGPLKRPTV
jgi:hypothetical protein